MQFKQLKDYAQQLFEAIVEKKECYARCNALNEDLSVSRHEESIGNLGTVAKNRAEYEKYSTRLKELTAENVFANLFKQAAAPDQELLNKLFAECESSYKNVIVSELNKSYQMCRFIDMAGATEFANKEFDAADIALISNSAEKIVGQIEASYDAEIGDFTYRPNEKAVKELLPKKDSEKTVGGDLQSRFANAIKEARNQEHKTETREKALEL